MIKFGYEEGMKTALAGEDFDAYIAGVFTHTQAHYRHAASLGTTIEFEVCNNYFLTGKKVGLFKPTFIPFDIIIQNTILKLFSGPRKCIISGWSNMDCRR